MRQGLTACAICFACAIVGAAPTALAQQSRDEIYASLERVVGAAVRIERTMCGADEGSVLQGAIDGVNAMPERKDSTPIRMQTRDIQGFARAYVDFLEIGAVDALVLERAAVNGMVRAFDETAEYDFQDSVAAPGGGVMVDLEGSGPNPVVVSAYQGGPAERAGVLPGDKLIAIDGQPTAGVRLRDNVRRLQGAIGSTVTLSLERNGAIIEVSLERVRFTSDDASFVRWRVADGIGVISVASFGNGSADAIRNAIRDIQGDVRQPAGYVLDLRDNPGGLLDQVVEAVDLFIDGGQGGSVRPYGDCRREAPQNYNLRRGDEARGAPLAVLINGRTALGSEWVSLVLRERRGAKLIGQRTFGSARVHTVFPIGQRREAHLRLTTGLLAAPSGATWEGTGLAPDVETPAANAQGDPALER